MSAEPKTLYDKIWEAHEVGRRSDGNSLLYIDLQLLHEVTSPQAFEGLQLAGRPLWRVDANLATPDHNVPTSGRALGFDGITDEVALEQVVTLDKNCKAFGVQQFEILDPRQGIVHVVGPEQGATMPGMTVVCGDSHTSTHGAFAALAQGIGTSEVEHVMATQCLVQNKAKNFAVNVTGALSEGVTAKDLVLAIIGLSESLMTLSLIFLISSSLSIFSRTSQIKFPSILVSFSLNPRVVIAGVPKRIPLVTNGDRLFVWNCIFICNDSNCFKHGLHVFTSKSKRPRSSRSKREILDFRF